MATRLKPITKIEEAINNLLHMRKELDLTINELRALLPRRGPSRATGMITNPMTGKKEPYKFNK